MKNPVVIQLFFNECGEADAAPDFKRKKTFHGFPLWKPKGQAVYRWAVDYVVCSDERWVVVGPFTWGKAELDLFKINVALAPRSSGFRIIPEHCFLELMGKLPHAMWTDG